MPELTQILQENGSLRSKDTTYLSDDDLRQIYRWMVLLRVLDTRMLNLQRQGRIGFYGPTTGQEAATIASAFATGKNDWIVPALREAGAALVRGMPLRDLVAQCMGNTADVCKGRQMPCHYTYRAGNYVSMSSVIGTQISHGVGIAMAMKYRKQRAAVLCYLGDGATSANDFHAGMNFAAVYKAPVVFICQNNQWAISVPSEKQTAAASYAQKAVAYGMPWHRIDGNDALAVYQTTQKGLERAYQGEGPVFIEAVTYRRLGHSSSDDPSKYRDEAVARQWEKKDPIERLRKYLESKKIWNKQDEENLQEKLQEEITAAIREVEASPAPEVKTMFEDVYATMPQHLAKQRDGLI